MPQIILFQDITRRYIDSLISEVYAKIDKIDRFNKLGIEDDKNSGNS